jgi:hypothetical protein
MLRSIFLRRSHAKPASWRLQALLRCAILSAYRTE